MRSYVLWFTLSMWFGGTGPGIIIAYQIARPVAAAMQMQWERWSGK